MVVADERPYQHCAWTSRVHPWPVHQAARTDKNPSQMLDQIYGAEHFDATTTGPSASNDC